MSGKKRPILFGSIIHLQNRLLDGTNGGYLDAHEFIESKPIITGFNDPRLRGFVMTHKHDNRLDGSGSWQILSADGKLTGERVVVGDNVYLLSLYQNAGFLDSFEWIPRLTPFAEYPMRNGAFTVSVQNRGAGATSIWTIKSAQDKPNGAPMFESDPIYLQNGFPQAGFLHTFGHVDKHQLFNDLEDVSKQKYFVLTGYPDQTTSGYPYTSVPTKAEILAQKGSHTWECSLSTYGNIHLYDFYSLDLLKGQSNNVEVVANVTRILLRDAFQSLGGISTAQVAALLKGADGASAVMSDDMVKDLDQLLVFNSTVDDAFLDDQNNVFQVMQLLNLYKLARLLRVFHEKVLFGLMERSLDTHERASTFPPLHLFRRCFRYTAHDHEIIQRAITQRRWGRLGESSVISEHAAELLTIDKLASDSLAPFKHLLVDETAPLATITYFSDTTHIRRIPYTNNFILVSVSYDRIPTAGESKANVNSFSAFELMAIPHEVGHYIYHYGTLADGSTFEQMSEQFADNPYYRWCEEIFADLYGCVIAGPLAAIGMQALLMSTDKDRVLEDDAHHPAPLMRPYILSEMLRVLGELMWSESDYERFGHLPLASTADQLQQEAFRQKMGNSKGPFKRAVEKYPFKKVTQMLDDAWTSTLKTWGYRDAFEDNRSDLTRIYFPNTSAPHLEKIVNVDRVINRVRPIIKAYAKSLLYSNALSQHPELLSPWSQTDKMARRSYYEEMAKTLRRTADKEIKSQLLLNCDEDQAVPDGRKPDRLLRNLLDEWMDKWPHIIGGH